MLNRFKYPLWAFGTLLWLITACSEDIRTEKYPSGQIRIQTPYQENQKHGTEIRFDENGKIQSETPYQQGKIQGMVQEFYPNGELRSRQPYQQGVLDGKAQWFHENKTLAREIVYEMGKMAQFPAEFDTWGKPTTHGQLKDSRDGRSYEWIRIGEQVWTAENMDYPTVKGSLCLQCGNWGRLYDYDAAQYACPTFFALPTVAQWKTLISHVQGQAKALKAGWGWDPLGHGLYGNGTDDFGFGALAGGGHFSASDVPRAKRRFQDAGKRAYFWTAEGQRISIDYRQSQVTIEKSPTHYGYSVRCLLQEP